MTTKSIKAEFYDPARQEVMKQLVGLSVNMDQYGPVVFAKSLKEMGYHLSNGFVLRDYILYIAKYMDNSRGQIKAALREEGFDKKAVELAGGIWALNVEPCKKASEQCQELFKFPPNFLDNNVDWHDIDVKFSDTVSGNTCFDILKQEEIPSNLIEFLSKKVDFPEEPEKDADGQPKPVYAKMRSIVHILKQKISEGVPIGLLKASIICKGDLSPSFTDRLLTSATGRVSSLQSLKASIAIKNQLAPWGKILRILESGGNKDDISELLNNCGLEEVSELIANSDDDLPNGWESGLPLDCLMIYMAGNDISDDLSTIEQYKASTNNMPKSDNLPFEIRFKLHATAKASATRFRLNGSLEHAIVTSILKGKTDIKTSRLINHGLYSWFSNHKDLLKTSKMDARNILKENNKDPLLYLRSHIEDTETIPGSDHCFEEILVNWMGTLGPVVALNNPTLDAIPPKGTYKLAVKDQNWRNVVLSTMLWSQYVVIKANSTDNLIWEIDLSMQVVSPEKLIIVFDWNPKEDVSKVNETYLIIRSILYRHCQGISLPENEPDGIILSFGPNWETHWYGDIETTSEKPSKGINEALDDMAFRIKELDDRNLDDILKRIKHGDLEALLNMELQKNFEDLTCDNNDSQKESSPKSKHQLDGIELFAYIRTILEGFHMEKYNPAETGDYYSLNIRKRGQGKFFFWAFNKFEKIIELQFSNGLIKVCILKPDGLVICEELINDIKIGLSSLKLGPKFPELKIIKNISE